MTAERAALILADIGEETIEWLNAVGQLASAHAAPVSSHAEAVR